jgi:hypothetical protein
MMMIDDYLKVLVPFAKAADDYEPPKVKRSYRNSEHVALSLTVGHLREARKLFIKLAGSRFTDIKGEHIR